MLSNDPEAARLANAAAEAFTNRDLTAAQAHARALLLQSPRDSRALLVLGLVAIEHNDLTAAKHHLDAVKAAPPHQPQALNALGAGLARLGDLDGARAAFRRAGELGFQEGWRNLGSLESGTRNWEASLTAYERVLAAAPQDARAHAAIAHIYERRHELERAIAQARKAIAADDDNAIARVALARALLQQKDFAGAEAAALPVAQSPRASNNDRSIAWGVIGDARDQAGDTAGAFAAFTAANQLVLAQHGALLNATHLFYHPGNVRRMTELAARANIAAWRQPEGSDAPTPAFLVGFPRSGTTLLDQILSSHSAIVCLEERQHFSDALLVAIDSVDKVGSYEELSGESIDRIRQAYWLKVRAEIGADAGKLVVDKLPLNIVVLPLIKRVFPDAKIILALRDPRDVILSCFQQRFGMNAAMVQFLRLDTAASYYDLVMRLMETCRQTLALDLHETRYEDVIADLDGAARRLAAFLGVAFEPAMLSYRETALKRHIETPSARQVIEPLYTRSITRWRRYQQQLSPILPILAPWAECYGYEPP